MLGRASAAAARAPLSAFFDASLESFVTGANSPLRSLWASKPAVVVFLRRLGCQICRLHARDVDKLRRDLGERANVVCLCFEKFGEGSDADRSFEKGKFFEGDMFKIDVAVYEPLFGHKGVIGGFFGLMGGDVSAARLKESTARGISGNVVNGLSQGFMLGGSFVVDTDDRILLDHRQTAPGDDAEIDDMLAALATSKAWKA